MMVSYILLYFLFFLPTHVYVPVQYSYVYYIIYQLNERDKFWLSVFLLSICPVAMCQLYVILEPPVCW